jgi:hypothetical protein
MAQGTKGPLNYRCPVCFSREIDVDLFYDRAREEYYCIRCPYTGPEREIKELNERNKFRYKAGFTRITEW